MTSRPDGTGTSRSRGADSSVPGFPGFGESAPLDLSDARPLPASGAVVARLVDGSFDAWAETAAGVGYCARPVRLTGRIVDRRHGHRRGARLVLVGRRAARRALPGLRQPPRRRLPVLLPGLRPRHLRDDPRRARRRQDRPRARSRTTRCCSSPSPPRRSATSTAPDPSAGAAHRRPVPTPRHGRELCRHGRPVGCMRDPRARTTRSTGPPLCADCYDWDVRGRLAVVGPRAVATYHHRPAPRPRHHARCPRVGGCGDVASLQYAKVAEYQARGLVHFHALVRLDGPDGPGSPAPAGRRHAWPTLVEQAVARGVTFTAPAGRRRRRCPDAWPGVGSSTSAWSAHGQRTDDPDGPLSPEQVAGYLAKYATKDANSIRDRTGTPRPHLRPPGRDLPRTSPSPGAGRTTGSASPYLLLGKWAHMLGFRGHFSTKSRRYSVTLGRLRRARHRFQVLAAEARRTGEALDVRDLEARLLADDEDTTLVIGSWAYQGTGWTTPRRRGARARRGSPRPRVRPVASRSSDGQSSDRQVMTETGSRARSRVMTGQADERLWSVEDVSDYLGVPVSTIYCWRSAGTGPPGRRMGKRVRFRPQDVRDWVANLSTEVVA